jgi:hypothetical protein
MTNDIVTIRKMQVKDREAGVGQGVIQSREEYFCKGRDYPLIGLEIGGQYFGCGHQSDRPKWRPL